MFTCTLRLLLLMPSLAAADGWLSIPLATHTHTDACRGMMQLVSLGRGAQHARHAHASDDAEAELESVLGNGPLASAPRPQTSWPIVVRGWGMCLHAT